MVDKNKRSIIIYIIGFVLLVFAAFYGRDLSDPQQLKRGILILIAFVGVFTISIWVSRRRGIS